MERVVITGMGIYSSLGKNLTEVRDSLRIGRSGIVFRPERKDLGYRSALSGHVERPDLKKILSRRARVMMPEQAEFAYVATLEAIHHAGLTVENLNEIETGIIYGNDSSAQAVIEGIDVLRAKKDTMLIGSGSVFQVLNSTVTMNLATIFKLKGINFTLSAACASGSHAVGLGYMYIKQGLQKRVICGGAQEVNEYSMPNFDALGTFSTYEGAPEEASKPFDKNRDGLVPGGGAATLILESLSSALERGAPILAEVVGYGFSSNGGDISNPDLEGQVVSIKRALDQAQLSPELIDYVNAHATSTPAGDGVEAQAIYEVFGGKVPVSSTKSLTGHECWMAGASELVYSLLMMKNGFIAPNINFKEGDEFTEKINIIAQPKTAELNAILSNSFGFGGTNSSVVIRQFDPSV